MNVIEYEERVKSIISFINEIDEEMLDILSLFVFHDHLSTYQIHKIIAKFGKKIAYKNSRQKVQKLIDLKLIEKEIDISQFNVKELEKGAKYYKLSEEGIFALFYNSSVFLKPSTYYVQRALINGKTIEDMSDIFIDYKKEIFKNHQNSIFFELFLFPWLSIKTIETAGEKMLNNIIMFLNECCNAISNNVLKTPPRLYNQSDIDKVKMMISEIIDQQLIIDIKKTVNADDSIFLFCIEEFYGIEGIIRIKRGADTKNNIFLTQSNDPNRLIWAYKDKANKPNIISFYRNTKGSSLFTHSLRHKPISDPLSDIIEDNIDLESLYFKAVFSIVIGLSKDDNDLKLLKEDVKFMETLSELKDRFKEGYELLAK